MISDSNEKIIDNFFDRNFADYLNHFLTFKTPHFFGHVSLEGSIPFYSYEFNMDHPLLQFFIYKINTNYLHNKYMPLRLYINVQYIGMNGTMHTDDGDMTCLYMASETLTEGSGEFEIEGQNKHAFVNNRLILFNAKKLHMGHAPIEDKPRITLVLKTKKI
jgi:hypothetical protein